MEATARSSRRGRVFLVAGILLVALVVRVYQLSLPLIWLDEAYSIRLGQLPVAQIIFHTTRDVHPPLYYVILHYWMLMFGSGEYAVRGLSVVIGTATVGMAMLLTWRLGNWRAAVIGGLLLAVLPAAVWYSQQVRMYALVGLCLMTATYLLWRWASTRRTHYLAGYGCMMLAAMYTHYLAAPCVLAHWAFVLGVSGIREGSLVRSRAWWICHLVMLLGYLPWLPHLLFQWENRQMVSLWLTQDVSFVSGAQRDPLTLIDAPWFAFSAFDQNLPVPLLPSLMLVAVLSVAAIRVWRQGPQGLRAGLLLLGYCFIPVVLTWAVSPTYMHRYMLYALLGLPLVLAIAVVTVRKSWGIACLTAILVFEGVHLARYYERQVAQTPGPVMARINAQWRPGDAILAADYWILYTTEFYNETGQEVLLYTQNPPDSSGTHPATFGVYSLLYGRSPAIYVADPIRLLGRYRRVWLVSQKSRSALEDQLDAVWKPVETVQDGSLRTVLFAVPADRPGFAHSSR